MSSYLRTQSKAPHPLVWVMIAIGILLSYAAGKTEAAELTVPPTKWHGPISYYTGTGCPNNVYDLIDQAAEEAEQYSVPFTYVGKWNSLDRDGRNTIDCSAESPFVDAIMTLEEGVTYTDEDVTVYTDGKLFILGTTRAWHYVETGQIFEFDIWLSTTWLFLEPIKTIRHEVAHALGVIHSNFSESLMYPSPKEKNWDVETIAKLDMQYGKCIPRVTANLDTWIPRLEYQGQYVYGVWAHGSVMPEGVSVFGPSRCGL